MISYFYERKPPEVSVEELAERFWPLVDKTDEDSCWIYNGSRLKAGYGQFYIAKRGFVATHLSWYLTRGTMPQQLVLHKCDNPPCVNPNHLFEGSHQDNVNDMMRKGRGRRSPREWRDGNVEIPSR